MRTPKPQEVFIIIDDDGLPKRSQILTENTQLFDQLKNIYQIMAQVIWKQIHEIVCLKVESQKNPNQWSYNALNSICWTTGCFAGHIPQQQEQSIFVTVLRSLLEFIKFKQTHEDKMVIASNIMYLISSYKNYLNQNKDFLDIVIRKLMEFINEDIGSNVPEMAINSILTISQNIKQGVQSSREEQKSFYDFIKDFEKMRKNLQVNKLLEGCLFETAGNIIYSLHDPVQKAQWIEQCLQSYSPFWMIVNGNLNNQGFFEDSNNYQMISFFIKINCYLSDSIGPGYLPFFTQNMLPIERIYSNYLELITNSFREQGENGLNLIKVRAYRLVRKNIISLIESLARQSDPAHHKEFVEQFQQVLSFPL